MVRVGLVVPGFSANAEDWCIPALRNLVQQLALTDSVRVLALRYPYRACRYNLFGADITAIGGGSGRRVRSVGVWGQAIAALAAEHRRQPFDLLHAFWANETGALAVLAGRLLGIPTIVSLAGGELVGMRDLPYGGQLSATERVKVRTALGLAHIVTAGSESLLELAEPWVASKPPGRVRRVPLGVDTDMFRPPASGSPGGQIRLIHVASLCPVKDQATLLRAAAELRDRRLPFQLEILGSGGLAPDLRAMAKELDLQESVHLRGDKPHDRLPGEYGRGAIFVLSSRHEAQGMAILEAAACGLPTVGTRVGVLSELAPEAAITVPVGDYQSLAEATAELIADETRRRAMGQSARERVEAEFSLWRCVETFRELYAELLQ